MHSLWHYIETWPAWQQITLVAAFFTSIGLTLRELLSFVVKKIRMWWERRIDNKVVAYLVREAELHPVTTPDAYGHDGTPHYCSTIQIAEALKRSAVDILARLEMLELFKRVERPGRGSDYWTVTKYEVHDKSR